MKKNQLIIDHNLKLKDYKKEISKIFLNNEFTKGDYNKKFSKKLSKLTGAKFSFLTSSCTTALSVCLEVLNIKKGDEVAIADFSWIATAHVVENVGAKPVFIDVNKDTFNMSHKDLIKKITKKTKAVIFVDSFGNPSGLIKIKQICKRKGIPLIEDAACGIGSKINNKYIGNISDFTCFSFHARKILTTGEGGAIQTNSQKYAKKISLKLKAGAGILKNKIAYEFVEPGYNFRLSEIQALIGLKQINTLKQKIILRNKLYINYKNILSKHKFKFQKIQSGAISNIQSSVFIVPEKIKRNELIKYLRKKKIGSIIGTYSLSATNYYKKKYNNVQKNSFFLFNNTITLPCHNNLDVNYILKSITDYVKKKI